MKRTDGIDEKPSLRLTSGVPGLDNLLLGGFIPGGVYLFLGPPGSGKTVLGNQICFHHAKRQAGSIVYITLLAESHSRMMGNLTVFEYFNSAVVGSQIHYISGYRALETDGLKGLLLQIAGLVKKLKATLLVIDGVTTIGDIGQSPLAFRRFTHELNTYIAASGCTAFLLSSMEGHHSEPEHTMVDGIIALHHDRVGLRSLRQIEVRKFRGSNHLQGKHHVAINDQGIKIIPRLEALPPPSQVSPVAAGEALSIGISELDKMMGGGVAARSITTVIGAAGTGKTTLALQFLHAGAKAGEKGLFFGFYETPTELIHKSTTMGLGLGQAIEDGLVEVAWHPTLELELDELGESLLQAVRQNQVQRVVIDGVDGFRYSTLRQSRINRFFIALILRLKAEGVTTLIIEELKLFSAPGHRQVAELSALNENLVHLQHLDLGGRLIRAIALLKVRSAIYDSAIREFRIGKGGATILSAVPRARDPARSNARAVSRRTPSRQRKK